MASESASDELVGSQVLNDTGVTHNQFRNSDDGSLGYGCDLTALSTDCTTGRDADAWSGRLNKKGHGAAGFDYTFLDESGQSLEESTSLSAVACVQDNVTGLVWEKLTEPNGVFGESLHDGDDNYYLDDPVALSITDSKFASDIKYCFAQADEGCYVTPKLEKLNQARYCGVDSWRLPTLDETVNAIGFYEPGPLNVAGGPGQIHTASRYVLDGGLKQWHWVGSQPHYRLVSHEAPLLAVAGDQVSTLKIEVQNNGTLVDLITNLQWSVCPLGFEWNGGTTCERDWQHFTDSGMDWSTAYRLAEDSMLAGFSDWRLPNIKELWSINDISRYEPTINEAFFHPFNSITFFAWSSTPANSDDVFYTVHFRHGHLRPVSKSSIDAFDGEFLGGLARASIGAYMVRNANR